MLEGTYQIVRRIGQGGMGVVYEARHARLAGRYAVKVLRRDVMQDPDAFRRFRQEAEITSGLRHPGIVQVVDFNVGPDRAPFLVMEYLEGSELATIIQNEAPLAVERVLPLVEQLASALAAAHRRGIVHRDLKPQNVFVLRDDGDDGERIKIVDFGISKVRSANHKLTSSATVLGTPQYMAPEQALGQADRVDQRTDQFALACIVYEMLTGRPAFAGDTLAAIAYQIAHGNPEPPSEIASPLREAISPVLNKALSKNPEDRYATVADLARTLRAAVSALGNDRDSAPPDPPPAQAGLLLPPPRSGHASPAREPAATAIARGRRFLVGAGLAAAIAVALAVSFSRRPVAPRPQEPSAAPATIKPDLAVREVIPNQAPAPPPPAAPPVPLAEAAAPARETMPRQFRPSPRSAVLTTLTAMNNRALQRLTTFDFAEAERILRRALQLCVSEGLTADPSSARIRVNLGIVLLRGDGDRDGAIQLFKDAIAIVPDINIPHALVTPSVEEAFAAARRKSLRPAPRRPADAKTLIVDPF
jgi:tRNA A-37 threonylcarbamoyl transferase component Bud32